MDRIKFHTLFASFLFCVFLSTPRTDALTFECPKGWNLIGTHCYNFVDVLMDFEDAIDVCEKYGAKMLTVRDEVEAMNVSVVAAAKFVKTDHYWIYNGQNDRNITDRSVNSTFCEGMWQQNEPRETVEDVAVASNLQGRWALRWIWTNLPFVCRAPACPSGSFRCSDGTCLNMKWMCDGDNDCPDYSDENNCPNNMRYYDTSGVGNIDMATSSYKGHYQWIIEGRPGDVLRLDITTLTFQENVDIVRVYSGGPSIMTSNLLQEMRKNVTTQVTVYSTNQYLIVVLEQGPGSLSATLKASYAADPVVSMQPVTTVNVTDTLNTISSPYFNSTSMPRSFKMEWLLVVPDGQIFTIEVLNNTFGKMDDSDFIVTNFGFMLTKPNSNEAVYISNKNKVSIIIKTRTGKRVFSARLRTGCDFTTTLSFATISLMSLPTNITCSWTCINQMNTNFRLRLSNIYFGDANDFFQISMGISKSSAMLYTTLNSTTIGAREFDSLSSQIYFTYFSDNVRPGNMIKGKILADCPNFQNMSNINVTISNNTEAGKSYTASISCLEGFSFKQEEYRSNASLTAICSEGGMWDWGSPSYTRMPECQIVYCGIPPQIRNGFVSNIIGNVVYKGIATYQCYDGFQITGSPNVTCDVKGTWSVAPTCEAEKCPTVPVVVDGTFNVTFGNQSDLGFGTVVKYTCTPGYDLIGAQTIVCLKNKTWSHASPSCIKLSCPLPMTDNGKYTSGSPNPPELYDVVTLTCAPGYQINRTKTNTDSSITCTENRSLDPKNDFCEDIDECSSGNLNNCSAVNTNCINNNGSYSCVCKKGYNGTNCQDIDECALNICDQNCTNLNGSYSCFCQVGYTLYTQNGTNGFFIPAGENGLKSGDVYQINNTCVPVTCNTKPVEPGHGKVLIINAQYIYNDTVDVICDFGYQLEGSSYATCQSTGNWTYANNPTCKSLSCTQPPTGKNEAYRVPNSSSNIEPQQTLIISCNLNDGSGRSINKTMFCALSPDGSGNFTLQGDNPECPEVNCGMPLKIPGATNVSMSQTVYRSSFEFTCDKTRGFTLTGNSSLGNSTVICQSNGFWGYGTLTCEGSQCKDPGTLAGTVQIVKTSYEIDQIVQYNCTRPGFTPSTNDTLVCEFKNGNATWSGSPPKCEDTTPPVIACPILEPFDLYSSLVYPSPNVTDNSGLACLKIVTGVPSGVSLVSENTTIKYSVSDSKIEVSCEFNVTVKDYTEPTIECNSRVERVLVGNYEIFNLTVAVLKSYSGDGVIRFDPIGPLNLTIGSVVPVRANITKTNGLFKECAFMVFAVSMTCMNDSIVPPDNGRIDKCTGGSSSMTCTTVCNDGYLYQNASNSSSYSCTNGTWDAKHPLQPCIKLSAPTFDFNVQLLYKINGHKAINSAQYDVSICYDMFGKALPQLVQKMSICGYNNFMVININRNKEVDSISDIIGFTLQLVINNANQTELEMCANTMLNQSTTLFGPTSVNTPNISCLSPWTVTVDNGNSIKLKNMACNSLSTIVDFNNRKYCLPCGPGMFLNNITMKCQECQDGYYQDEEGKSECKPCQEGVKISYLPRTSNRHCYKLCPQGYTSTSGYIIDNCTQCSNNFYSNNATTCLPCPNSGSTLGLSGATSASKCSEPCPIGQYSITGYFPCTPCPVNFYNDVSTAKKCKECPSNSYTVSNGSKSSSDCLSGASLCTSTFCNSTGVSPKSVCEVVKHRPTCTCKQGYSGDSCKDSCNACNSNPCYNGGECTSSGGFDFKCTCKTEKTCNFEQNLNLAYTSDRSLVSFSIVNTADECKNKCNSNNSCVAYLVEKYNAQFICYQYKTVILSPTTNNHDSYTKNCSLKQLFDGPQCEKDLVNNCNDSVCSSLNFCMDLVGGTKCQCPQLGSFDSKCAKSSNLCQGNNCNGHGKCIASGTVRSVCECYTGYTGTNCETDIDECSTMKYPCLYNGTCQQGNSTYSCNCINGFSGNNCEKLADFCAKNDCQVANGGICTNNYKNLTASCTCGQNYMLDPQKPNACVKSNFCMSNLCVNGTCVNLSDGFKCNCNSGFEGAYCQHNINDCVNQTCQNGGSCLDLLNNYTCVCPNGFSGRNCEINIDDCKGACILSNIESPCIDLIADYRCPCKLRFTGKNCSDEVDVCDKYEPCLHGGTCLNIAEGYNCTCPNGWVGKNCDQEYQYCNSTICKNQGKCLNLLDQYYCQCPDGTAGKNCENMEPLCNKFSGSICTANGKCELAGGTAQCQCRGESTCTFSPYSKLKYTSDSKIVFFSQNTESECRDMCFKNASCVAYLVESNKFCFQYNTVLEGTASMQFSSYIKNCTVLQPYYSGVACELEKNYCAGNPCNGGVCTLNNLSYVCDCSNVKNYGGKFCKDEKDVCTNTCPMNVMCKKYFDEDGNPMPACMCPARQVVSGNMCKTVDPNYDLVFLETFANKGTFVTSERGFYLEMNTNLSVSLWVAAANKLDEDKCIFALKSTNSKEPFLSLFNKKIVFTNNGTSTINLVDDGGISYAMDDSFTWHFISITWSSSGLAQVVFDFNTLKSVPVTVVVPPMNEVVFVHLGKSFFGYISQVYIWSSILTNEDILNIYGDKSLIPQETKLLLGWTTYSYDDSVQKITPSTAIGGISVCKISHTIAKMGLDSTECKSTTFLDKMPPQFSSCNESVLVPTSYSKHQVSSSDFQITVKDEPGENFSPENQLFSYGAYDVAISVADKTGNIGVCMTRAYITPNQCSSTTPTQTSTDICQVNSRGKKVMCPSGQMPSVAVPNFVMCSKLQTFNLENMYEQPDGIVCGVMKPRSMTLNLLLPYTIGTNCANSILSSVNINVKNKFSQLNNTWPGLCSPQGSCDNINVNATCKDTKLVHVQVNISSLGEYLNSTSLSLTPQELMTKIFAEKTALEINNVANAMFNNTNAQLKAFPSCEKGYSLLGIFCVQCGPGSYYHEGEMKCKLCEQNKYTLQSGSLSCTDCPTNQVTFQKGSSSSSDCKEKCPPGQMYNTTSKTCVDCPRNFYQDQEGKSYCFPCPPSSGTEKNGTKSLAQCKAFCPPGTELRNLVCVNCQRGYYREGILQDPCTPCSAPNITTKNSGSIHETDCIIPKCAPGNYVQGNTTYTCQPCDYGKYQPNEAEFDCLSCQQNFTTENTGAANVSLCQFVCPSGHEEYPPNSRTCVPCKRGYYRSGDLDQRFKNCTMCPGGNTTIKDGSTNKVDCNIPMCMAGMYLNVTEQKCYNCPYNFYQNATLQVDCKPCPKNLQTKMEGATSLDNCTFACPAGYEVDGTSANCTLCPRGTYKDDSFKLDKCKNCTSDTTTDNLGAMSLSMCNVAKCMKGYYVSSDNKTCLKCPKGTYQDMDMPLSVTNCTLCKQNSSTENEASTSINDCKVSCQPGYGVSNGTCEPCPRGKWNNGNETLKFSECQMCPMNFTTDVLDKATSVGNCTIPNCQPGTKIDNKTNGCLPCEIGFYQNQSVQYACVQCPSKTSTNNTGSSSLLNCTINCPPGESGETNCTKCSDDQYKDSAGFGQCLNCTGNLTSTPANRSVCTEIYCDRGCELKGGNCVDCVIGFYKDSRGNTACMKCPGNLTTSKQQSTSASDCSVTFCESGFYSEDNKTCKMCPSGTFKSKSGNENCTECPKDFTTDGMGKNSSSDCYLKICSKGQFRNSTNQCQACKVGFYQNMTGQTFCQSCPTNETTMQIGSDKMEDCRIVCQEGYYRNDSVNKCFLCPRGTYQNMLGKNECIPCTNNYVTASEGSKSQNECYISCPQGNYRNGTGLCVPCPVGEYQNESDQVNCKKCDTVNSYPSTTFSNATKQEMDCYPLCPEGLYLNQSSRSCNRCPIGTYKMNTGLETSCQLCSSGLSTNSEGSTSSQNCTVKTCGKGYYREANSDNCKICPIGKFQNLTNSGSVFECTTCPENTTTLIEGATDNTYCITNCPMGQEYKIVGKVCSSCPVGQYRPINATNLPICLYCPEGLTNLGAGSSNCTIKSSTTRPNIKIDVSVVTTFVIEECGNPEVKNILNEAIMKLIINQDKAYIGLCSGPCNLTTTINIQNLCGVSTTKKRQADKNAQIKVTEKNVDPILKNSNNNDQRSSLAVLGEAFYKLEPVQNDFDTYKIKLVSVAAQNCSPPCVAGRDGYPLFCTSGQFAGNMECKPCPKGTYSTNPVSNECITCPSEQTTNTSGSTNKTFCDGECFFNNKTYCGTKGTCQKNANGISYCQCQSDSTGVACNQRVMPADSNTGLVVGISVGVACLLLLALLIIGCCVYKKNQAKKKNARKFRDKSLESESEVFDYKYPLFNQPMVITNPTAYSRHVFDM